MRLQAHALRVGEPSITLAPFAIVPGDPSRVAPSSLPSTSARKLLETRFIRRMIVGEGSLRTVAIDTSPARWRAEARPAGDLDAACLELLRQGFRGEALRVAEMAATRSLVEPERQRRRQGDVTSGK